MKTRSAPPYRCTCLASIAAILFFLIITPLKAQEVPAAGARGSRLRVGTRIPRLAGVDQLGKRQNFESLKDRNGLVLLFFRSADW